MPYIICNNCNEKNVEEAVRCSKCNAPLLGSMLRQDGSFIAAAKISSEQACGNCGAMNSPTATRCVTCNWDLPKTKEELGKTSGELPCPSCQYPNLPMARYCVQCNTELHSKVELKQEPSRPVPQQSQAVWEEEEEAFVDTSKSFNPFLKKQKTVEAPPSFKLKMIQPDGEAEVLLQFEGQKVELNRNNLEPANNTITSKVQAELQFEEGKWTIENKSTLGTTFIKIEGAYELKPGDTILLGNRMFKFEV